MKNILLVTGILLGMSTAFGQYCLPTYNSQCTSGDFIDDVAFNTISNLGTGCTSPSINNYHDYTATISTSVQQNTSYTITVKPGPSWGQYFVAYIDFNNDFDFDDPGEFFDIGYAASGTTISNTILIPSGIPGGSTTMRVLCKYSTGAVFAGQACNSFSYGETEDYTLNISSPLTNDAGIASFVTPTLPTCSFTDSVRVELSNYGSDTLFSADISFSLNAGGPTTTSWTGALAPFSSETVNLGLFPLASGDNLVAIASMPNGVVENPLGAWNDLSEIVSLQAGLSGIKTIGGVTPDYVDFASAVADISTFGLCGAVIFDIRDGIYNEQIDLTGVASNAINNLTFRSENGDASLVTLSFPAATALENFVVKLSGTDYVTFEDLTLENSGASYGRVLDISGGSDSNRFENCHLRTLTSTSTSTNYAVIYSPNSLDNGNVFMNNIIEGGSYGTYFYGESTSSLESGTVFDGNEFLNNYYYGIRLERMDAPVFTNNTIHGTSTYTGSRFALYINYCDNASVITHNAIYGDGVSNTGWRYGIYMLNCDASSISRGLVANNMIQAGTTGSTSTFYGMYSSNNGFIDYFHNSVLVSDGGVSSRGFFGSSGGANSVVNNIFVNNTAGYAYYLASNYTVTTSNNNLLHSPNGNIGYYGGGVQATLGDFQAASGADLNSIDMDPLYYGTYDLHVCNDTLKGLGSEIAIISDDIDGHPRSATSPDMGADEFTSLATSFLGIDTTICAGDSLLLWAGSPTDIVTWSTGETSSVIWVNSSGTYSVNVVGACGTANDTIVISASAGVYSGYIVADTLSFCTGGSVQLNSSMMADTYLWTGGSTNDSLTVTVGGTYTLDITDGCGSGSESIVIEEYSTPTASFTSFSSYFTTDFTNTSTISGTVTYSWDFGDATTSTDSDPIHIYAAAGTYWVELTVTNECGTHVFGDSITASTVGIEEISDFGTITVYPNPSSGLFQIDFNLTSAMDVDYQVVNLLGEVILIKELGITNGVHSDIIDLTESAPGVYFVKILSNNKELITKILMKK